MQVSSYTWSNGRAYDCFTEVVKLERDKHLSLEKFYVIHAFGRCFFTDVLVSVLVGIRTYDLGVVSKMCTSLNLP